ncbi:MAG TPA: hypothetical protein VLJ37_10010 [bacterium]|nr:hypothetical protein [bacterium]
MIQGGTAVFGLAPLPTASSTDQAETLQEEIYSAVLAREPASRRPVPEPVVPLFNPDDLNSEDLRILIQGMSPEPVTRSRLVAEIRRVGRLLRLHEGNRSREIEERVGPMERAISEAFGMHSEKVISFTEYRFEEAILEQLVRPFGDFGERIAFPVIPFLPQFYAASFRSLGRRPNPPAEPSHPILREALARIAGVVRELKGWEDPGSSWDRDYLDRMHTLIALRAPTATLVLQSCLPPSSLTLHEAVARFEDFIFERGWALNRSALRASLEDLIAGQEPPAGRAELGFLWDLFGTLVGRVRGKTAELVEGYGWVRAEHLQILIHAYLLETRLVSEYLTGNGPGSPHPPAGAATKTGPNFLDELEDSVHLDREISENPQLNSHRMFKAIWEAMVQRGELVAEGEGYRLGRIQRGGIGDPARDPLPPLSFTEEQRLYREFLSVYRGANPNEDPGTRRPSGPAS